MSTNTSTYLELDVARKILDAASLANVYSPCDHQELWAVFNLGSTPSQDVSGYVSVGIEKIDSPEDFGIKGPIFDDDLEAWKHVKAQATRGSETHARAIEIHHAADSVRFHLWGEEWIDSRIGPEEIAA